MTMSVCAVFLCNKPYFDKFLYTCQQLLTNGQYTGPICLVIGDDLQHDPCLQHPLIQQANVAIKYFPTHKFSNEFLYIQSKMNRGAHWFQKLFQYHKLYLFDTYFKKYDYILYLDCSITIFSDVAPILNERRPNTLLAHSDAYPTYQWTLAGQFEKGNVFYTELSSKYNLLQNYFQTTMMLYDTAIIEPDTYQNMFNLLMKYPISITNDQAIIALYFSVIHPRFQQLRIQNDTNYFYDYLSRGSDKPYIMLKSV